MWSQYSQPDIHPVELHELSLEELTGTRPTHKGTLMYLKQKGIPEGSIQFQNPGPQRGHLQKVVHAIEHDFYTGPVKRHAEVHPPVGTDLRLRSREIGGPPRSPGYRFTTPMSSRELMTGRRDGRAAALFQRMKDRSDQYVVEDTTMPAHHQQDPYGQGQGHRVWQQSPWDAAAENALGLPDKAFEHPTPKPKPRPKLQNPAPVQIHQKRGPPVYSEVDSIRQHQRPGKAPQIGCSWKGETSSTRFHSGVRPYEMDYNLKAKGWSWNLQSGSQGPGQARSRGYDDSDGRPKSWMQEDGYSQARPRGKDVARSRQVVSHALGASAWGGESDDL